MPSASTAETVSPRNIERLYRGAPMLLIGEGTVDIRRMIIGRRLLETYSER
ncbi:acyl-CoA dehydrogenase family protein [Nocardia violaceofusca]|uniref:acyl-CoA dehydrogenase family protein n=1 Tax=Nocardia violaceofusca TaxID=941182 RepID=UPI000B28ADBE